MHYRRELGENADELAAAAGQRLAAAGMRVWTTNDAGAATSLLDRATTLMPSGSERAALLWEQAITLRLQDRLSEATAALNEAEQDARASGARAVSARVAAERAEIRLLNGDLSLDDAIEAFNEALSTLRSEQDERGLGRAELLAGSVHWFACNLEAAAAAAERAATHYHASGLLTGRVHRHAGRGAVPRRDTGGSRRPEVHRAAQPVAGSNDRGDLTAVLGGPARAGGQTPSTLGRCSTAPAGCTRTWAAAAAC